jgi:low temperature requirement protein LtrA
VTRFRRRTDAGAAGDVAPVELFYDLVFVFAVTQVSHVLLEHLTWTGAAQSALLLLVAWWAWNYTTWVTNELDLESALVRLLVMALTLATLLLAVSIPQAFGDRALLFAGSYVAIQVGRHAFLAFAAADTGSPERERAARILTWFAAAGALWLGGAFVEGAARAVLWVGALTIDYAAPLFLYWIPGRPPASHRTWEVATDHFAERFQLFVIIALGESIVLIGATTAELELTAGRVAAFALAFVAAGAMWWLYFNYVARIAQRRLELSDERTRLARDGYTYLHVVIVAGVIVGAVGSELAIAHPWDRLPGNELAAVVAGPALYLLGHVLFRLRLTGTISRKRLAAALGCVAAAAVGLVAPAVAVLAAVVGVLVTVIAAEHVAAHRRRARGEPTPLDLLARESPAAGLV